MQPRFVLRARLPGGGDGAAAFPKATANAPAFPVGGSGLCWAAAF